MHKTLAYKYMHSLLSVIWHVQFKMNVVVLHIECLHGIFVASDSNFFGNDFYGFNISCNKVELLLLSLCSLAMQKVSLLLASTHNLTIRFIWNRKRYKHSIHMLQSLILLKSKWEPMLFGVYYA